MARRTTPATVRDQTYERRRDAIIREAARAFAKNGYAETSLEIISTALGLTKPALYYYFKEKNELLFECHAMVMTMAESTLKAIESSPQSGAERLVEFVRQYTELITRDLGSSAAILAELNALKGSYRKAIMRRRDTMERRLVEIARQGCDDGSIRPLDPQIIIFLIMGAVNWIPVWFDPAGRVSGKDVAATLAALCSAGLGTARAGTPP